jgi:hypothetical protein
MAAPARAQATQLLSDTQIVGFSAIRLCIPLISDDKNIMLGNISTIRTVSAVQELPKLNVCFQYKLNP